MIFIYFFKDFLMWTIFELFVEFVTILLLFNASVCLQRDVKS